MKKRILAMTMVAVMSLGTIAVCHAEEQGIKLTIPYLGLTAEEQAKIDANLAEGKELTGRNRFDMAVMESIATKYPDWEVEYADWGWAETLDQKQRSLIAAGNVPDIVIGETFIPTYALEGILEPLPQDIVDSVYPSMLVYDKEGNAVAVAYSTSTFLLFYNKTLLEQCGYTEEQVQNMTWDEWQAISDDITAQGNGEFWGGGIPTFPHAGGSLRVTPFLRMMGTDFGVDYAQNLSDPKLQEVLEFVREMDKNFPQGIGNGTDENPLWNMFAEGTLAFGINGCYQVENQYDIEWGVTDLPVPEEGADGNCLVGSAFIAVPKGAPNIEASFNVVRETLAPEHAQLMVTARAVGTKEIVDNPEYWEDLPAINLVEPTLVSGNYSGVAVFEKNSSSVWDIIHQNVLARTTMTDDPIEEICNDAIALIDALG